MAGWPASASVLEDSDDEQPLVVLPVWSQPCDREEDVKIEEPPGLGVQFARAKVTHTQVCWGSLPRLQSLHPTCAGPSHLEEIMRLGNAARPLRAPSPLLSLCCAGLIGASSSTGEELPKRRSGAVSSKVHCGSASTCKLVGCCLLHRSSLCSKHC